jgi:hypothetical protein
MADGQFILDGTGTDIFSGIAVSNFQASLDWYQRLFGAKPSFFPNETEAVWAIAEHRWIYIIVDAKRAGGAIQTINVYGVLEARDGGYFGNFTTATVAAAPLPIPIMLNGTFQLYRLERDGSSTSRGFFARLMDAFQGCGKK